MKWVIGNGHSIRVWKDTWLPEGSLRASELTSTPRPVTWCQDNGIGLVRSASKFLYQQKEITGIQLEVYAGLVTCPTILVFFSV